jgi:ABC-type dipeptide/oligopeptide/nickel transport system ATPase component
VDSAEPLLSVRQLSTRFDAAARPAVDHVSFDVPRRSIVGLVGDSGSGKSLTALSILRLLPPDAHSIGGEVWFRGRDLLLASEGELRALRGRGIAMIFQEPRAALSAVHTVGWQLAMALRASGQLARVGLLESLRRAGRARARELLERVELPEPERMLELYPHQLSAGMRRRVMIALALACRPSLLIADEPTTGLDAPIQAQILDLFLRLVQGEGPEDEGRSVIFITHDLCVAAEVASEIVVLYAGQVVEAGPTRSVLGAPQHPYTLSLLQNIPGHDFRQDVAGAPRREEERAGAAAGQLPTDAEGRSARAGEAPGPGEPQGCRFAPYCPVLRSDPGRFVRCSAESPLLAPAEARHRARCFYPRLGELERE